MTDLTRAQIDQIVLKTTRTSAHALLGHRGILFAGVLLGAVAWTIQISWASALAVRTSRSHGNVSHQLCVLGGDRYSGTLISAILHLFRAGWRNLIARAAETMTVFAVVIAGLFLHSSRTCLAGLLYDPHAQRASALAQLPLALMFDVVAISTYLTVSSLFWYTGLLPDLACVRDRSTGLRHRIYRVISLGWTGSPTLAPLQSRVPFLCGPGDPGRFGSQRRILGFRPRHRARLAHHHFRSYFVAGAIHSGLAMVLTLMIPCAAFSLRTNYHRQRPGKRGQDHDPDRSHRGLLTPPSTSSPGIAATRWNGSLPLARDGRVCLRVILLIVCNVLVP
jgi:molybdopterin-containing oxidoreductase family membrane subunit